MCSIIDSCLPFSPENESHKLIQRYNKKSLFVYLFFTMKNEEWEEEILKDLGIKKDWKKKKIEKKVR